MVPKSTDNRPSPTMRKCQICNDMRNNFKHRLIIFHLVLLKIFLCYICKTMFKIQLQLHGLIVQ